MACVSPNGTLTHTAVKILKAIQTNSLTAEELANVVELPLYKIRSGLRDLVAANFVEFVGDKYKITEIGLLKIK